MTCVNEKEEMSEKRKIVKNLQKLILKVKFNGFLSLCMKQI